MNYERLSKRALGCIYTAEIIGDMILLVIIGAVNYFCGIGCMYSWSYAYRALFSV